MANNVDNKLEEVIAKEKDLRKILMGENKNNNTYENSYLIEAGAGAGKTHTMTNRIINQLIDTKCKPEELVAITFTEKATQEMLSRIDSALRKLVKDSNNDEGQKELYQNLLDNIDKMQISTIHSFCQTILSLMPFYSSVGPGFKVMDDAEINIYASRFFAEKIKDPIEQNKFKELTEITGFKVSQIREKFLEYAKEMGNLVSPADIDLQQRKSNLIKASRDIYKDLIDNFGLWKLKNAIVNNNFAEFSRIYDAVMEIDRHISLEDFCKCKKVKVNPTNKKTLADKRTDADIEALFNTCKKKLKGCTDEFTGTALLLKDLIDSDDKDGFYEAFKQAVLDFDTIKTGALPSVDGLAALITNSDDIRTYSVTELFAEAILDYEKNKYDRFETVSKSDEDLFKYYQTKEGAVTNVVTDYKKINADANVLINDLGEKWLTLAYAMIYDIINPYIKDFRKLKLDEKRISQNDLLFFACKMLREHKEAREYFHSRYKCIYVDEMQDTNPVQAQLLFYLTADKVDDNDWTKCEPVSGSLFLVGDPKQAIYRFTGADITVYNSLKNNLVFSNTTINLTFNNRSTKQICDYVNKTFQEKLRADDYQAGFTESISRKGASNLSASVVTYGKTIGDSKKDAEMVVSIIDEMVRQGVHVGKDVIDPDNPEKLKEQEHPAEYKDFLILTTGIKETANYAAVLAAKGIPCNLTGQKMYEESPVIGRGIAILKFLLETGDATKLVTVLNRCYGISLDKIASFKILVGSISLNSENVRHTFDVAEEDGEEYNRNYEEILNAIDELKLLKDMVYKGSGMAVLEYIFDRSYACWRMQKAETQASDYAMTRQLLNSLKDGEYGSFFDLAEKAINLAKGYVNRELSLEKNADCVRVMNLHKAKGLESEVVILAYAQKNNKKPKNHIVYQNSEIKIYPNWGKYGHVDGWDKYEIEESKFLEAEKTRLLYVAATRPKSMLFICAGGDNKNYWEELVKSAPKEDASFVEELLKEDNVVCGEKNDSASIEGELVDVNAINDNLEEKTIAINKAKSFSVSPSKLNHGTRSVVETDSDIKEHGAEEDIEKDNQNTNAQDDAENAETQPKDTSSYEQEHVSDEAFIPFGSDWGTMVHRVMELLVQNNSFDKAAIGRFSVQAILETVDTKALNKDQERKLLNGNYNLEPIKYISSKIYDYLHTAAVDEEDGEFRKFIADADALYPELPFTLYEEDGKSAFAAMVYNAVKNAPEERVSLDMEGIMDLVVVKGGKFYIIDYKTDKLAYIAKEDRKETEDEYKARLIGEYTNQLNCYKAVLEKNGKSVGGIYICALSLKGELMKISVN